MQLNELARVVIPTDEYGEVADLFLNKKEGICLVDDTLQRTNIYKFDTWMNLFAAKKYDYYCDLGTIYLKANIKGKYKIIVTGVNRNAAFDSIEENLVTVECVNETVIEIPNAKKYEGIYFTIIEYVNSPVKFFSVAWCTDQKSQRDGKLAIVSCTFKREAFITRIIKKFEDFKKRNQDLNDKIYMFISDNGRTLPESLNSENVRIFPNMNAGGAGGFTRGLMEVMKLNQTLDKKFTRVLFMDDDVEIFPESFYRTLVFSNYLKKEFEGSFVNGAMLDLYQKNKFYENLSVQHGLWLTGYYNNIYVNELNNILKTNFIPPDTFGNKNRYVSSAWWYCCFPIQFAYDNGLPLPIFIRGDDAEWSWRACGQHIISMNGICIWHAPFEWRVSKVAEYYYTTRNMFFLNVVYTPNFKNQFSSLLKNIMGYLLNTYDYTSLEIFKRALEDVLKGKGVFEEEPEQQFQTINKINNLREYVPCNDDSELGNAQNHRVHAKKWRKYIWRHTHFGRRCPSILFKKRGVALEWFPPIEDFVLVKEVKTYNIFIQKYEIRKFNRKKLDYYEREIIKLINCISEKYDELHDELCEAHKEFTSLKFWTRYLKLEEKV